MVKIVKGDFKTNQVCYDVVFAFSSSLPQVMKVTVLTRAIMVSNKAIYGQLMIDTLLMKLFFNYLNPESDQHLNSPYSNTAESFIKIMRIKEMIPN